ncbi:hypothetical protein ER308_16610 [Egibacter rhizosphaerae]|uniref:Restriction endonuclease type IV Mrr domain-containing protein n=1 Tax=Egibacter rhizosphaerae TaxID=1670831 RepID=A0A411YIH7_9ACTN|nr:hypothetical protein ER308_16610 [Egibacter rhizosphaerae]
MFITTSRFGQGAQQYADQVSARVVLIDGNELGRLMVEHSVGAETQDAYSLKRVDEAFFQAQ